MSRVADREQAPKRRKQQRAIDTQLSILRAALSEFADKGFDGASMRTIAETVGLQHQLITYHYRTKDVLWQAVAGHVFTRVGELWNERVPADSNMTAIERVREEYRGLFSVTLDFPDLHRFMLRENRPGSPRLAWVSNHFLKPLMGRVLPHIVAAQAHGDLPECDPVLLHYMLVGMTTVLPSMGVNMNATSGRVHNDPQLVEDYWALMEAVLLKRKARRSSARGATPTRALPEKPARATDRAGAVLPVGRRGNAPDRKQ